jgi:hypothetical protein
MNLRIESVLNEAFPVLAWVAKFDPGTSDSLTVWCGRLVESGSDFVVEGLWPGRFEEKAFDTSELFYGSGLRIVGHTARFVSSCSTVDRLWSHNDEGKITISNSLPCLLSGAEVDLVSDDDSYAKAVETVVKGRDYQKQFAVSRGQLQVHYFENLELHDGVLTVLGKDEHVGPFPSFESYSEFLFETADQMGRNAADPARKLPLNVLSTISKGYDSPVASLLAKRAGAHRAFTITSARSLFPREDSGAQIAERIGLSCEEYINNRKKFRDELWYWAANGSLQDMNFSLFDYLPGPSVIFTGFNGDMVWSRSAGAPPKDYLKRKDSTGLGFCEHRLVKGVIHCPVPFWGIRQIADIKRISEADGMKPWALGGDYDRPVPRRIAEEAGVPRELFGQRKGATTVDELLLQPLTSELTNSYFQYLETQGKHPPQLITRSISRFLIDTYRSMLRQRLFDLPFSIFGLSKQRRTFEWENYLLPWSNEYLKKKYSRRDN